MAKILRRRNKEDLLLLQHLEKIKLDMSATFRTDVRDPRYAHTRKVEPPKRREFPVNNNNNEDEAVELEPGVRETDKTWLVERAIVIVLLKVKHIMSDIANLERACKDLSGNIDALLGGSRRRLPEMAEEQPSTSNWTSVNVAEEEETANTPLAAEEEEEILEDYDDDDIFEDDYSEFS
ncbi:hypothetical protein Pcinc_015373 [Petrolisthes cinctipes]|uniref:Uncharacterized protein n=1 Tax=Petrolisthes cinctipes TaxID=88211 RepID=A0AAE1KS89_PETCI|nr:hypothetical protein Pcinc_015373 [Petrolisthes cinctipes]